MTGARVPALAWAAVLAAAVACAAPAPQRAHERATRTAPGDTALTDDALLERVQRRTFRYFWDFGHPVSGLARERSNRAFDYGDEVVTTGGTGFGVMAMVVAAERGWVPRAAVVERLLRMTAFLRDGDRFDGVFPHWLNGETGRTIPFSPDDDGGDVVETAYLMQGLLTARQYFAGEGDTESALRARIDSLWHAVDWTAHVRRDSAVLMWNRSPRGGFRVNVPVRGWNEALITYVLAASSPTHPIDTTTYHHGWARDGAMRNGREYHGIRLPLGPPSGGPLFFEHYSFLGLDPRGLRDRYTDYEEQVTNHTRIQIAYARENPKRFRGYGEDTWGLTSCDVKGGYSGHSPTHDTGVIAPTAALSSFPYTPVESMRALRRFHDELGDRLFREYGFVDAFDETHGWVADSHLAIDQGPIIVMIENHRTGLPWRTFMSCPEVRDGLRRLGFESPALR